LKKGTQGRKGAKENQNQNQNQEQEQEQKKKGKGKGKGKKGDKKTNQNRAKENKMP